MKKNRTMWDTPEPEPEQPKQTENTMQSANDRQVGADHYKKHGQDGQEQHWDRIIRLHPNNYHVYFVAVITKYVERYQDKGGVEDLEKAGHYLQKLIETHKAKGDMHLSLREKMLQGVAVVEPQGRWAVTEEWGEFLKHEYRERTKEVEHRPLCSSDGKARWHEMSHDTMLLRLPWNLTKEVFDHLPSDRGEEEIKEGGKWRVYENETAAKQALTLAIISAIKAKTQAQTEETPHYGYYTPLKLDIRGETLWGWVELLPDNLNDGLKRRPYHVEQDIFAYLSGHCETVFENGNTAVYETAEQAVADLKKATDVFLKIQTSEKNNTKPTE